MSAEALPDTSRRRRLKLSTASTSLIPSDLPEEPREITADLTQRSTNGTGVPRRRLEKIPQGSALSSANGETRTQMSENIPLLTGRGRLREVIAKSKIPIEKRVRQPDGVITSEEQANFFTGNWDGLPRETLWPDEVKPVVAPQSTSNDIEVVEEGVLSDGDPLLVSELRLRKNVYEKKSGIIITQRKEQLIAEENIVPFVPKGMGQEPTIKLEDVRLLEDEGFYVGERPLMAQRNMERMKERLLSQNTTERAREWLDESGQPLALPDPLRHKPLRILPPSSSLQGQKLVSYRKAVAEGTKGVGDNDRQLFRLEVSVGRLQFSHHYLYSLEHVLASKLQELHSAYVDWLSRDLINYWRHQLEAVRLAVNALAKELAENEANSPRKSSEVEIAEIRSRHETYSSHLIFIRKQLNAELLTELSLTRSIINAWRCLKEHRKTVNFIITGWKLVINRMMLSQDEIDREVAEWRRDVEEETEELYQMELREFNRAKAVIAADQEMGPAPDRESVRKQVMLKANECRKQPGSPRLAFDLQPAGITITPVEQLPRQEQNRRHDVTRTNVWLRLVVGNSLLTETSRRPIGSDFSIDFDHTFSVLLSDLPESIAVEIHESTMSNLASVYVPIPDATAVSIRPLVNPYEFTCPNEFPPSNSSSAVGCGLTYGQTLVCGSLKAGSSWSPDAPPPPSITNVINAMNAHSSRHYIDVNRIRDMIASGALDPNHPNNAELVYLLRSSPAATFGTASSSSFFRLEHMQDEFNFISDDVFAKSSRYRILELRDKDIGEFRKLKMVPADERDVDNAMLRRWLSQQVDTHIFSGQHKNGEEERTNDKDDVGAEFDIAAETLGGLHEFEVQRLRGARHLQRSREAVIQQLNIAAHKLTLADVVFEDDVPSIRTGLEALARVFEPRRPLMPKRIPRKKIPGQNLQPGDVNLIVSVLHAHIRLPQGSALGSPENLRIYVEVTFQEKTQDTSVAIGTEPTWNEKMQFPFRAPNDDFSPTSLQSANDYIYISIFARRDKVLALDARGDASVVTQRLERRWLGTLKLRWSAVYLNTTIEGTFYVPQVEPSLLGTNQLLVSVHATLSPALLLPDGPPSNLPTGEDASLVERATAFSNKYSQRFPSREVLLMVIDITGKQVFVSRYMRRITPPQELVANGNSMPDMVDRRIARFVSLIPFVSDMAVFPCQIDVWATTEQFLSMLSGDDEEHSCLLVSYFLELGRTAFLAIGMAIPEGRSTYVISETQDKRFVAWEPKTGIPFDLTDPFCPLQTIDCIITQNNVYANVQHSNRSAETKILLSDRKLWDPFFADGDFSQDSAPLSASRGDAAANAEQLAKSKEAALRLRLIIRDAIHRELNKWREPGRNAVNRLLSHRVQERLQHLESQRRDGTSVDFEELSEELDRYGVTGFTLQQPFTSVGAIIDAVRATRVWQVTDPEVTYVLAVHVEPYPMTILAVWVYVGIQSNIPSVTYTNGP